MSNTSLTTKVQQSRGWTLALGIAAAVLAAILLVVYLVQYRSSVNESTAPDAGARREEPDPEGDVRHRDRREGAVPGRERCAKDDLKIGAISDPAYLNGRVAVADIFPGQQITTADLSAGSTDAIPTQLSGKQRAVAIPVERCARPRRLRRERRPRRHLLGERLGTRATILGLLAPDVLVMRAPAGEGQPDDPEGRRRARPEARARVRQRDALVPPAPGREREGDADDVDHERRHSSP